MSPSIFKTLTNIVAWTCFIFGLGMMIVPTVLGIAFGGLAGTINSVETGQIWFYQHGLAYLLGMASFVTYLFAVKVRKSLD